MDAVLLPTSELSCAQVLAEHGVEFLQYRNKQISSHRLLEVTLALQEFARPRGVKIVVNDRPDVAAIAGTCAVHVGQTDLPIEETRKVVGPHALVGVSTHSLPQVEQADASSADYIAFGPVFATSTKADPDPVAGLEGLRAARNATRKPLVAIGGITLARADEVYGTGADCIAVARDVLCASNPGKQAQAFLVRAAQGCAAASFSVELFAFLRSLSGG
jgi:thiamine-phosphate pyrophosphorylase